MGIGYRTTMTADIIIEREFGSKCFLDLYSNYVAKKILEFLEKEKCLDDESIQKCSEQKNDEKF